jgi:hypothetical protein
MSVLCSKCKNEIPAGRLKALPGTTTCVNCSGSKMKRAVTIVGGEKEDTYNDLVFMEAETYESIFGKTTTKHDPFQDSVE